MTSVAHALRGERHIISTPPCEVLGERFADMPRANDAAVEKRLDWVGVDWELCDELVVLDLPVDLVVIQADGRVMHDERSGLGLD